MQIRKLNIRHKIFLEFGVIIFLTFLLVGYAYFNFVQISKSIEHNLQGYKIIREADAMMSSLLEIETGARGYALTGKEEFLQSYRMGIEGYHLHENLLKKASENNSDQKQRMSEFETLFQEWVDWQGESIKNRNKVEQGLLSIEDYVAWVESAGSKYRIDVLKKLMEDIIKDEERQQLERYQLLEYSRDSMQRALLIGGGMVVFLTLLITYFGSQAITNPILELVKAARGITERKYQNPLLPEYDQEINVLINAFNSMQSAIEEREKELRHMNEELKIRMAETEEANRLKSQFLANMSHELRTPLNSIIGFTTRVIRKSSDILPPAQLENLNIVKTEGNHLLELINTLLDYSKIEAGKMELHPETFVLKEVIDETGNIIHSLIEGKPLEYRTDLDDPELSITSDQVKLKQILLNLLSNAAKYSDQGHIDLKVRTDSGSCVIQVQDEGIGIAPENLENIFDEFRQVDGTYTRKVGGTGLGLSITRKLVEMLGGRIEVSSRIGEGSCFTVTLPLDCTVKKAAICEDALNKREKQYSGPCRISAGKIVCVDDDLNVQKLYRQYLTDLDYELVSLNGTENVLEEIIQIMPDLVLLDIMLPRRDGWDILAELKKHPETRRIPVVMASVLSEKNLAYRMKADDYLIKPVTQEELISVIRKVADHAVPKILVADDDENFLRLMGQFLAEESLEFHLASSGRDALKMMGKQCPDILILDIMMPELDGFAVLDEMQSIAGWENISVIIVTSKDLTDKERDRLEERAGYIVGKSGSSMEKVLEIIMQKIEEKSK